jgi:pentatricopeptide repeat protein
MLKANVLPNIVTFNSAMSSCEKAQQWEFALAFFKAIPKAKASPDRISFDVVITACKHSGHWQVALRLFEAMRISELKPDVVIYDVVVSCCEKSKDFYRILSMFDVVQMFALRGITELGRKEWCRMVLAKRRHRQISILIIFDQGAIEFAHGNGVQIKIMILV